MRSGTTWSQQAYVKASNTGRNDRFGISVALSDDGDTLAVGAYREDSRSGAAYVYTRAGTIWDEEAYVKAANAEASDFFGYAVDLSGDGNTLAVAAYLEDSDAIGVNGDQFNADAAQSGAVYVFTRSASAWTQQGYVKASNTDPSDRFGIAIALSSDGNALAVGASYEQSGAIGIGGDQSDNSATQSGAGYLY
jgi:hypothetical protein